MWQFKVLGFVCGFGATRLFSMEYIEKRLNSRHTEQVERVQAMRQELDREMAVLDKELREKELA